MDALVDLVGTASWFGGPGDEGVAPDEGLALIESVEQLPQVFLPYQPEGTTGLARRLNPAVHYVACRWDYNVTPKDMLLSEMAFVRSPVSGLGMKAYPVDWGPHEDTEHVADLSPSLMDDLIITTGDEVEVFFPYTADTPFTREELPEGKSKDVVHVHRRRLDDD